jgi:hypothetical protein
MEGGREGRGDYCVPKPKLELKLELQLQLQQTRFMFPLLKEEEVVGGGIVESEVTTCLSIMTISQRNLVDCGLMHFFQGDNIHTRY